MEIYIYTKVLYQDIDSTHQDIYVFDFPNWLLDFHHSVAVPCLVRHWVWVVVHFPEYIECHRYQREGSCQTPGPWISTRREWKVLGQNVKFPQVALISKPDINNRQCAQLSWTGYTYTFTQGCYFTISDYEPMRILSCHSSQQCEYSLTCVVFCNQ